MVFCVRVETLVIGSSNRSRIGWLSASNRSRALGSRSSGSVDDAGAGAVPDAPRSAPSREARRSPGVVRSLTGSD